MNKFKFEKLLIWQKAMDLSEEIDVLAHAIRSLAEVVTCQYKAKRRNYLDISQFEQLHQNSFELMNMMIAFRNKIN